MKRVAVAIVFAVIGFLVAVLGGISKKHDLGDQDCKGSSCNVKVMFECTVLYFGCHVVVDYEMTRQKKDTDITWQIDGSHFEFDGDKGIVFNERDNGFKCRSEGKQKVTCQSPYSGLWKYTINVKTLDPLDPWVYQP